jgi:glucan endo-1,3-alpha-glucosidase
MKTFVALCVLAFTLGSAAWLATAAPPKMVFAHYLIYADDSIETYKQEIQLAQSKGIDAFALNTNVWRKQLADNIYKAASDLGTGFNLFFSADIHKDDNGRLSPSDIVAMLSYRTHPNQLQYNGKSFFTSWLGDDDGYWSDYSYANAVKAWNDIFSKAGGKDLYFFMPFFPTDGSYYGVKGIYDLFGSTVDGYYGWDTSAWNYKTPDYSVPAVSPGDADSLRISNDYGKTYMAMVSPWFFKNSKTNSDCCDSSCSSTSTSQSSCPCQVKGDYQGSGLWLQKWSQIIANPSPLVEIVTWNDWIEGHYISPPLSTGAGASGVNVAAFPHQAYLELGKHYIQWYKTGSEPVPTKDEIYLFYFKQGHGVNIPQVRCGILNADKLTDTVVVVVVLTAGAPAQLTLRSGGYTNNINTSPQSQGVFVHGIGFQPGTQSATIRRGSVTYTLRGDAEISNSGLTEYNFNVYSIFCSDVQDGHCGQHVNVNSYADQHLSSHVVTSEPAATVG